MLETVQFQSAEWANYYSLEYFQLEEFEKKEIILKTLFADHTEIK